MYTQEQIDAFLIQNTGIDQLNPNDDLLNDQGVSGDDFHEMIDEYAKTFKVNMTGYLWYFHANEEGGWNSIGSAFFDPPYKRVSRIPITPALLLDIANKGHWDIQYPPHKLPRRRWDLLINQVLFAAVISWALYSCLK